MRSLWGSPGVPCTTFKGPPPPIRSGWSQGGRKTANLLNFDARRQVEFSSARELQFDLDRKLSFNHDRDLTFQPNRDLGFGKRGVLFRGYACANCGAIVSADAKSCDECGAVFDEPELKGSPMKATVKTSGFDRAEPAAPAGVTRAASPAPRAVPAAQVIAPSRAAEYPQPTPTYVPLAPVAAPSPAASASRFCPNCGARSWQGDAWCWNCGARFSDSSKVVTANPTGTNVPVPPAAGTVQLPPIRAKKVVKDWQDTGKSLEEYAEEK